MKKNQVKKTFLEKWDVAGYGYQIYEIDAGGEKWFEANPITKGVTRCANTEQELLIILNNDVRNIKKYQQRIR